MLHKVSEQMQHLPKMVKDGGDILSLGGILTAYINMLTPIAEFAVILLTGVWFIVRIVDYVWNFIDRWKDKRKGD